jgi:hypothetical protein
LNKQKYNGLDDLLARNKQAGDLFESLPSYVQDMIRQRKENITSVDVLSRYAENLVQGDK